MMMENLERFCASTVYMIVLCKLHKEMWLAENV